ncbi:MAG: hypothetical protein JKP98_23645 [Rhodobacteraceae bacterium]|nr:hypothetical protein [Paracoccaceae bacterium]
MTKSWGRSLLGFHEQPRLPQSGAMKFKGPTGERWARMLSSMPNGGNMVLLRVVIVTCVASFLACQVAAPATSQESATGVLDQILEQTDDDIIPIQTESPRSTLQTLYRLRDELEISIGAYWQQPSTSNAVQIAFVMEQIER